MMVSTIRKRKYVEIKKRRIVPTSLGIRVSGFLEEHFTLIFNTGFTELMESSLDRIASGDLETRKFLASFWNKFAPLVEPWEYALPQKKKPEPTLTGEACPVCSKGQIEIKTGKKGRFLGCNCYPKCTYTRDIKLPAPVLVGKECPKCGSQLCVRAKRNSDEKFIGCSNYPACRYTETFQSDSS